MRFGILGFLIFAIAFVTDAQAGQRVALVIGNSAYQRVPKLSNPVNDARSVAALLRDAGFDVVESRLDLDANSLKRAMRDFTDMVQDADVAVVYYAGHGIEVDGNNYLIPVERRGSIRHGRVASSSSTDNAPRRCDRAAATAGG